jgi:uncharacterized protein YbjT (DUF2867 family)
MRGAQVVIDVTNARSRDPAEVLRFFQTSTRNLIEAGRDAGVAHHLALSVVGADRMPDSGYMRGKVAQERAIAESGVDFTILRATQFYEFVAGFGDAFASGDCIRVPDARMQPVAIDDVASALASLAHGGPANGIVEIGGPEVMPIREAVSRILESRGDRRPIASSREVAYFGARLDEDTLVPGPGALRGKLDLGGWLSGQR